MHGAGCGVCGGDGVQLGIARNCCGPTGVITPAGYCCASGNVDDAGVCDGTGSSVPKDVELSDVGQGPGTPSGSRRRLRNAGSDWDNVRRQLTELVTAELGYPESAFTIVIAPSSANPTTAQVRCIWEAMTQTAAVQLADSKLQEQQLVQF